MISEMFTAIGKTVKHEQLSETDKKYFLYLVAVILGTIILAGFVQFEIMPAVYSLQELQAQGESRNSPVPVNGTPTPSPTPGQEKINDVLVIKGFDTRYGGNLPDGTRNIGTLIAINSYPKEFKLDGVDIYVTDFTITSNQISGYVENRGVETYSVAPDFILVKQNKMTNTGKIGHIYYTGSTAGSKVLNHGDKFAFASDSQKDVKQALSQTLREVAFIHPDFYVVEK